MINLRMAILLTVALAAGALATPAMAQVPNYDTDAYCERIFQRSYSLREICIENENRDRRALLNASFSTTVISYCRGVFRDSYSLLKICIENETSAKARLPQIGPSAPKQGQQATPRSVTIMRGDETSTRPAH